MNIRDFDKETAVCETCKGKADYCYFNSQTGVVLSIICNDCRDAFEATIKSYIRALTKKETLEPMDREGQGAWAREIEK